MAALRRIMGVRSRSAVRGPFGAALRSFSSAAAPRSAAAVSSVPLHCLDFPYLKTATPTSELNFTRGTAARDAPLLILHGLLGSAGNWRTTAPKLSSRRRILSLDVRNHGASPHTDDMRFGSCAADVIRLMDERGIDKAVLMGHSLGGKIAMAAALLFPQRIASVISVDMSPQDYNLGDDGWTGVSKIVEACATVPMGEMTSRSQVDALLKPLIPDFTTRAFVLQNVVVTPVTDPTTGERTQTVAWRCNLPALHRALPSIAGFDLQSPTHVHPYTQPALFIGGGRSPYLTPKQHASVLRHFPRAEIETIHDAGHWVHVEKTKEFVELVRNYLHKLEEM